MKAYLLHADRDLDLELPLPANAEALKQDLELETLFDAMSRGDQYLRDLTEKVFLTSLTDPGEILYRQAILRDCLGQPVVVRELYSLAVEALESKRKAQHFWFRDTPDSLLRKSLRVLELLTDMLRRLRKLADDHAAAFRSDGYTRFFSMLERDLADDYLDDVERYLSELEFRRGTLISAELGRGNSGTSYVLRKPNERSLLDRIAPGGPASYSFTIPARDEHGMESLGELRGRGINLVANALAQSTDHILSFFGMLRAELGFYVACLNLQEQLAEKGEPTCFPVPLPAESSVFSARRLYDACLSFHLGSRVVGNDVDGDGKQLMLITGANQGGKSTFLRSVGLAQLMMQAGMFVPAESLRANVCAGVFMHFKREEDPSMTSGKLDEELGRMSEIADSIAPSGLLLCNESFASTNEREGSEIARQVVGALVEAKVKVVYVTHLFDLADSFYRRGDSADALFLRAERLPDGKRTFRVLPGEPLPTSYGEDSYRRVFGKAKTPSL